MFNLSAQVKVGGNIYGGGNAANVMGSTTVTVRSGDLNKVFGGARMANVGGNTYVNIDGAHAEGFTVINYVYGGNDISGNIGTAKDVNEPLPSEMEGNIDGVDDTWNTYVHISAKTSAQTSYYTAEEATAYNTANGLSEGDEGYKRANDIKTRAEVDPTNKKIFIGQLFAGGNGEYTYSDEYGAPLTDGEGNYIVQSGGETIATRPSAFNIPEVAKSYLDVQGGSIVYAYGGGNNATVTEKAVIHVDNPTEVVNEVWVNASTGLEDNEGGTNILTNDRFRYDMGINIGFSFPSSGEFQIGRLFGGNNRAEMDIRPDWHLQSGKIRNLYSGGNRGNMTHRHGLLLEIPASSTIVVDNIFGGCRMADVCPKVDGIYTPVTNLPGYAFPNELSARVLVRGGDINNVYGGNDVTGKVYGGNAIGIYTSIRGDVYGGGNGAYPYTENTSYENDDIYGDLLYSGDGTPNTLNAFRPNAEQVSIRLKGKDAEHPTIIKGSVFVGGNCATLKSIKSNPMVELKIGSHVIADKVFLGNNGEKMVSPTMLETIHDINSSLVLTDPSVFAGYMDGAAMELKPSIVFDSRANGDPDDYEDYTSKIGSFYCGGNVGSMITSGKTTFRFDRGLIIFDKLVGGCNNANVEAGTYNAAYSGGILGTADERDSYREGGKIKDRIELSLDNLTIEPRRWTDTFTPITSGTLTEGETYYETNLRSSEFVADGTETPTAENPFYELTTKGTTLVWNTAKWIVDENDFVGIGIGDDEHTGDDNVRRLMGGNVYGGCYNSGHVNGNVVININQDLIRRSVVFADADSEDPYSFKDGGNRNSGVLLEEQGDDVQAVAMTVFGAGKGEDTEIWGSATVNLNNGYCFQIFGGGEEGVVGKGNNEGEYVYNADYSTYVNLKGINKGYSQKETGPILAEAEYLYGGGNEGDVLGDSYVYLGNGRIYDAFGGASNADIYGGTEVYIGHNGGFPWIRDNVYGGNDFGGTIRSRRNHTTAVRPAASYDISLLQSSTYVEYLQGRVDSIFGGNYGSYNYADRVFKDYTDAEGKPLKDGEGNPLFSFPRLNYNSFVHFNPVDNALNHVGYIFGGSEGYPDNSNLNNTMQSASYVLIDDTKTKDADRFANVDIYGGGAFAGVGSSSYEGAGRTVVDLFAGTFHDVYGGCNKEGLVGYTRINVPAISTIKLQSIFGGGQGYTIPQITANPSLNIRYCDNYVTCIDYKSANARVEDAIYGGNRNSRIAADTYISIDAPVLQSNGYQATIYGGGYGPQTVSGRTNVFMNNGSNAYKVFGGGRDGNVFNLASLTQWLINQHATAGTPAGDIAGKVSDYRGILERFATYLGTNPISLPDNVGTYVNGEGVYDGTYTNDLITSPSFHQTNVHIMNGGNVSGYAYGGGFGSDAIVSGTTYIELKGGNVDKDIYGGGQGGHVQDFYGQKSFKASTNVFIEGGMARNVYGGGYLGHVGKHTDDISASYDDDIPAVANVVIGKTDGTNFYNGIPAIMRNAYGGGEGGSLYGTANVTINNGYIGYRYKNTATSGTPVYEYVEELDDQKPNAIVLAGNVFGGGYVVNSFVDETNVEIFGGTIRGSVYGGGEVGPIGRGYMKEGAPAGGIKNGQATIYKAGKTHVRLFDGWVKRNVYGGGRGHDSWGGDGTLYMDEAIKPTLDMKSKGNIYGQTVVEIYGGEVGTDEGVAQSYGNVFGGSDIGSVYSAYELDNGTLCIGKKPTGSVRYDGTDEGYYYKYENGAFITVGTEKILTEDCKVLVEPWCKATATITINDSTFAAGSYVPTSYLNYLGNKEDAQWSSLSKEDVNKVGIIVHNAVFAGGNTSPGSTEVYANTTTVFGNATASIHDVYNRDLISIGRGRVGGLYGDGNLTLIDGYREVNITNYGTDYYHITPEITLEQYNALPTREAAYYEIRYKCLQQCTDKDDKIYAIGATITADEMLTVFDGVTVGDPAQPMIQPDGKPLDTYWEENGVCSRYAGRPMNTVQRADFCGVFGSRMVMQGAQDRVPETVDYTNYTINRVREVSLNKKTSVRPGDSGDDKNKEHGNYFGIYSVVNFLGALTSDVDFHDVRVTDNTDTDTYQADAKGKAYGTATYYDWKDQFHEERKRNNGNSHNKVALASGVYLELTNETGTGTDLYEKAWGLITGVVELDLINVQPGMGGGYVYAKNAHGIRSNTGKTHTILTDLNFGAVTNKQFQYDETEETKKEWETSGNFVHSTQTIIDDCYNIGAKYHSGYDKPDGVPAHYWFIKGAVYIYDQYISAFTGSPNAFSEVVSIPLTITSASHGRMTLLNVKPNHYAYYSVNTGSTQTPLEENDVIELRDKEYGRNDAINYWDYSQLTDAEKKLFVAETYVVTADCELNGVAYAAGTVLLPGKTDGSEPGTYYYLKKNAPTKKLEEDDLVETPYVFHVVKEKDVDFDFVFRPSNNVSHDTGYILTYNIDNPNQWNTWYTPKSSATPLSDKKDSEQIKSETLSNYEDGPTYTPKTSGLYGQNEYNVGSVIPKDIYDTYQNVKTNHSSVVPSTGQAAFYPAYIVTAEVLETTTKNGTAQRLHKDATLSKENYTDATWSTMSSSVSPAFVATSTIQLSKTDYIYRNTYFTESEITKLKDDYPSLATTIENSIVPAYYCTEAGKYGGNYYEVGHNYRALAAFTAMSASDRSNFTFNYDALDLLIDPNYSRAEGVKYQYDSAAANLDGANANPAHYSLQTPIDYSATYKGSETLTYKADDGSDTDTSERAELTRTEYESLPNEQYYWAPITVGNTEDTYYVVTQTIILGDTPYAAGQVITQDTYDGLSASDKEKVKSLEFPSTGTYYYCREKYTIPNNADGHAVTSATGVTGGTGAAGKEYAKNSEVPTGVIITDVTYNTLTNKQKNFSIHGLAPTETSTLYITRGSDIFDLSAEKIITVVYQYDYVESDMAGAHITPVSERHILNIHLNFKSGVPTVEDISAPDIILPGTTISIPEPYVTPGAYEITGGGWKLFDTESDAESHINGVEYTPIADPLYLYQNGHYLAYYAKTYLGETYSNHVPVSVANYHDLKKVIEAKEHHYYIDHRDVIEVDKVEPKIYINDYSGSSQNGLDLLKSLYDLSVLTGYTTDSQGLIEDGTFKEHKPLNTRVAAGKNLEFFMRTDLSYPDDPAVSDWTPIGTDAGTCFEGTFHGDGHTISGLDHSLFNHLCGDVYNLGVTGSFTGAGLAETGTGYVENCWISTSSAEDKTTQPVYGNPSKDGVIQVVNSYYQEDDAEALQADGTTPKEGSYNKQINDNNVSAHGTPIRKPAQAFYNGEVAFDLNGFYLYKRYNDHITPGGSPAEYKYWLTDNDTPQTGKYTSNPVYCSSGYNGSKYVEQRFADGDFRYAGGTIPTEVDERCHEVITIDPETGSSTTTINFYPIWPDDYLFFGQKLTYGYSATYAHQSVPTAVTRFNGRLSQNPDANRVYRAPAYFRNNTMSVAHFNPHAYLAASSSDGTRTAYPGMTAIDFADHRYGEIATYRTYEKGLNNGWFYQPLLDDDGLLSIVTKGETQNLLVYAPAETSVSGYANKATYDVLTGYFVDPAYSSYYSDDKYRKVADATPVAPSIYGHIVEGDLTAICDHLLVDKEEFNAPIQYQFDNTHRMWYQRTPENDNEKGIQEFVDRTKGWQGISIPFTAELVTTNDKGEITHFYEGSETSKNGTGTKIGHEYWLREFNDINEVSSDEAKASFLYPNATGTEDKSYTNTFLWDYYYENPSVHNHKDKNYDTYQTYYEKSHTYSSYPLLTAATPYILGLPGETYYEFDLSGNFTALNTAADNDPGLSLDKLGNQTITFASHAGEIIRVSDTEEPKDVMKTLSGSSKDFTYTFHSNYLSQNLSTTDYIMKADGSQFDKVTAEGGASVSGGATALPFRPYFTATAASKGATKKMLPSRILFMSEDGMQEELEPESARNGEIEIYSRGRNIITKSHMTVATTVRITSISGVTIANYVLQPDQTVETPVQAHGAYIVNKKKIFIK